MRYARSLSRVLGIIFVIIFSLNIALAQQPYIKPVRKQVRERPDIEALIFYRRNKLNFQDEGGNTLLHYAAVWGNIELVKVLLKERANKNLKDRLGRRPVAYSRNNEIASILGKDDFVKESERLFNSRIKITKTFDYATLWPKDVSVLFVGEYHYVPQFKAEVAKLIKGFKKSNVRLTHYATEFITKREQLMMDVYQYTPLPREKFNEYLRVKGEYAIVDKAVKESKIKIIGLDVDLISDMTRKWGASDEGLKERNKEWVKILMKILGNPEAKILIYCGVGHSIYSSNVNPVSTMLKERGIKVKVVELTGRGEDADAYSSIIERLSIPNEHFVVSVPKNKAQLLGADFIMNVPETKEEPSYIPEELLRPITSPFIDYKNK